MPVITLQVDPEHLALFDKCAKEKGLSRSAWIRLILVEGTGPTAAAEKKAAAKNANKTEWELRWLGRWPSAHDYDELGRRGRVQGAAKLLRAQGRVTDITEYSDDELLEMAGLQKDKPVFDPSRPPGEETLSMPPHIADRAFGRK